MDAALTSAAGNGAQELCQFCLFLRTLHGKAAGQTDELGDCGIQHRQRLTHGLVQTVLRAAQRDIGLQRTEGMSLTASELCGSGGGRDV